MKCNRNYSNGFLLLLISLLGCTIPFSATGASALMPLTQAVEFSNGTMRGVTTSEVQPNGSDGYLDSDFSDLAATKANLVRAPIPLTRCGGCSSYGYPSAAIASVEHTLQMGERYGFRVVVTLAVKAASESDKPVREYWQNPDLRKSIAQNWRHIAEQLKSFPALAAYDLINEPVPPGNLAAQQMVWRDFSINLVKAIRAEDSRHVIIFEPAPWAFAASFKDLQPLPFQNIVYSFHFYRTYAFTHQGVYPDAPYGIEYPNTELNKTDLSQALQPVRDFSRRYGAPIYVGEFSAARWAPDDGSSRYLKDSIELFEAEKWSWTYLGWRGYHGWDAEIPYNVPREIRQVEAVKTRVAHTPSMDLMRSYFTYNKSP